MKQRLRPRGRALWTRVWLEDDEELILLDSGFTPHMTSSGRLFVGRRDGRGRERPDVPVLSPADFQFQLRSRGLRLYRVGFDPEYIRVGRRVGDSRWIPGAMQTVG